MCLRRPLVATPVHAPPVDISQAAWKGPGRYAQTSPWTVVSFNFDLRVTRFSALHDGEIGCRLEHTDSEALHKVIRVKPCGSLDVKAV